MGGIVGASGLGRGGGCEVGADALGCGVGADGRLFQSNSIKSYFLIPE